MKKTCLAFLTLFSFLSAGLPAPYSELDTVLPLDKYNSFFNDTNKHHLKKLIKKKKVKTIIEVGTWTGISTMYMGKHLPPKGKLYAIDHFQGSIEHLEGLEKDKLPTLYEQFLSNMIHAGLTKVVVPMKMTSEEAAKVLNVTADLVYLDAAHDTESVYQDCSLWYPSVRSGGVFCGDDWSWESVRIAVERFAEENGLEIHSDSNFWWSIKP